MKHVSGSSTIKMLEESGPCLFRIPPGDGQQTILRFGDDAGLYTHYRFGCDTSVQATADDPTFDSTTPGDVDFDFSAPNSFPLWLSLLNTQAALPGSPRVLTLTIYVGN